MLKDICKLVVLSVLAGISFLWPGQAKALDLSSGEVEASLDTTISYGVAVRTGQPDKDLVEGLAAVNRNDGASNYRRGIISNAAKFTSDFDLGYRNIGLFLRATGFFDAENENGERARTPLSRQAKDMLGKDIDLLDAYVTGSFDADDITVDIRLGKHVLNWGESTFIPTGVSGINPFDVSKLRVPGAELREALVPVYMVSAVVDLPENLSVEAFYQLQWEKTVIDPVGTYFSVTDYAGPGATRAVIPVNELITDQGFGFDQAFGPGFTQLINADLQAYRQPAQRLFDAEFLNVARSRDGEPDDSGQWGMALRFLAEELNNTEFGFYAMNYHSRVPTVNSRHGTLAGLQGGLAAAGAISAGSAVTGAIAAQATPAITAAVTAAVTDAVTQQVQAAVQAGAIAPQDAPAAIQQQVAAQVPPAVTARVTATVREQAGGIAQLLAIDRYAKTGTYTLEYPEDTQVYGLSFNTQLGSSGWALQGEYSVRVDAVLQRKEENLIAEGLEPIFTGLGLAACVANPQLVNVENDLNCPGLLAHAQRANPQLPPTHQINNHQDILNNYIGTYTPKRVNGFLRNNVSRFQLTGTKAFGPALGADGWFFITEGALMHVHDMPKEEVESSALGEIADATSYGYRMAVRFDYNNAFGLANMSPYAQFRHDVSGNSPAPGGPFVKGLTGLTLGLRADYLSRWQGNISYTMFSGKRNKLKDRDFITATINYSF